MLTGVCGDDGDEPSSHFIITDGDGDDEDDLDDDDEEEEEDEDED